MKEAAKCRTIGGDQVIIDMLTLGFENVAVAPILRSVLYLSTRELIQKALKSHVLSWCAWSWRRSEKVLLIILHSQR